MGNAGIRASASTVFHHSSAQTFPARRKNTSAPLKEESTTRSTHPGRKRQERMSEASRPSSNRQERSCLYWLSSRAKFIKLEIHFLGRPLERPPFLPRPPLPLEFLTRREKKADRSRKRGEGSMRSHVER